MTIKRASFSVHFSDDIKKMRKKIGNFLRPVIDINSARIL